MSFFKRRPSRAQLLEQLAEDLVTPVIKEPPPAWLSENAEQPQENLRAEWIVLHRWIFDYTIQKTLVSYEKVQPLWETVERKFRTELAAQPCFPHFQKIVDGRAKEYGDWFNFGLSKSTSGEPLLTFCGFVATRILKPDQPLKIGLTAFEQEMEGCSMIKDIAIMAALSTQITTRMTSTNKFLKTLEAKVPQMFEGALK